MWISKPVWKKFYKIKTYGTQMSDILLAYGLLKFANLTELHKWSKEQPQVWNTSKLQSN